MKDPIPPASPTTDVRGEVLSCGHFVMEEKPQEILAALVPFLKG